MRNILFSIVIGVVTLGALTAYNQISPAYGQAGSDKVAVPSLTLAPANLPAIAATLPVSPTSISPTPSLTITASPPPSPTPTAGPLPSLLAEIPLAPPGERLVDILPDRDSGRLYVTDSAGQLHVLDANTYAPITSLPAAGSLTLDRANQRLYVSTTQFVRPEDGPAEVTIVDTAALVVTGSISPNGSVTVDSHRNRFYVTGYDGGIRLYDGLTLEMLKQLSFEYGASPFGPSVVYNPLRDELLVENYTVYSLDSETLEIRRDLFPDMMTGPCPTCYGRDFASAISLFPERNILLVEINTLIAGHGGGLVDRPHFFEATTLAELTNPAQWPAVESSCGDEIILAEPIEGRLYQGKYYITYEAIANLLVYDLAGNLVTWLDGLAGGLTNPNTKQMYISDASRDTLILDLTSLAPLGKLPALSCLALDKEQGRIYGFRQENLVIFSQEGGSTEPAPVAPVDALPGSPIRLIQPSPYYHDDQTLFLVADHLYRSQDGGQSWAQLGADTYDGLALSPDFAHDRTLFTYYGHFDGAFGTGVYRSTDGGDSWQPLWHGLTHLRVYDLILSPNYAVDGALLAYAHYDNLSSPGDAGFSLFSSRDRGLNWTLVTTATDRALLPAAAGLLPITEPKIRFRFSGSLALERTIDGGQSWETIPEPLTRATKLLLSANFATDQTLYAWTSDRLLRSTDAGESWQFWADDRIQGQDYSHALNAVAISPSLENGQHYLFIGTDAGEFWLLEPTAMTWEAQPASK